MKIGIIGLPQVGKKTLFELLTGDKLDSQAYGAQAEIRMGVVKIRDNRFSELVKMYQPKKIVPASIDVILLPKFDQETVQSGEFAKSLELCDALCHIVRAFSDESIFHVEGSVDPQRDIDSVFTELVLCDLILVEKRLERITKELMNKSTPAQQKEKEILMRMKELLDRHIPLTGCPLSEDEKKIMSTYKFLTKKPMIIVLNADENKLSDLTLIRQIQEKYKDQAIKVMQISAKIETELSALDPAEQETFLKELNIKESALNQLTRLYYEILGLMSFFTVGPNEVHAWMIRKGIPAPEAAGTIHSDMQRGFIRAEIMKSQELLAAGSETKLKEAGKVLIKGKDYIVEDGDVIFVRFNV
ncbi:MAG: redox-regulated ATPase YchF [Candidatus Omnitrophota bacterium]